MGASVGCQPSWDASDSPRCLTFLLALSKKKVVLFFNIFQCYMFLDPINILIFFSP